MSASQEEINWVLTSYIIAAAIMTAPTGFLAARFGRTRLFVSPRSSASRPRPRCAGWHSRWARS
jgi:DHA2 family multidrug resistance protein